MKNNYILSLLIPAVLLLTDVAMAHGDEEHATDKKPATAKTAVLAKVPLIGAYEMTAAQRLADGSLFVPKNVQRQLGLRTVLTSIDELPATIELNGKIIADPNSGGRVQSSQSGRITAGPNGFPVLGQKVIKGQILAYLQPVISSIERGNNQAQYAELEAQLAIAQRKLQRYEQLEGAVPQSSIEAARFELTALQKRRSAVGAGLNTPEPLLAPGSGIISVANALNGQVVDARDVLFEVIDPAHLAIEALAYEPALATGIASASTPVPGGSLELTFVGGGQQLRDQAMPLLFRIKSGNAAVAVGQTVKVIAKTSFKVKGAAVPVSALVKTAAGETAVWLHTDAERFVLRKVTAQSLDANQSVLSAGVADKERVVTDAASFLTQVR